MMSGADSPQSPMIFEVDVNEISPRTWRIEARSEGEAIQKALHGDGEDISGIDYTEGDVVEVRRL